MDVDGTIAESVVRRPPTMLPPYVESYVGYHYAGFAPGEHMGLPSRHLTFIVTFDAPLELTQLPDGARRSESFDTLVGGLHTSPAVIRHDGNQHGIQLQVTPAGSRALFRMPAAELASTVVTLDQLWGRLGFELTTGWRGDRLAGEVPGARRRAAAGAVDDGRAPVRRPSASGGGVPAAGRHARSRRRRAPWPMTSAGVDGT